MLGGVFQAWVPLLAISKGKIVGRKCRYGTGIALHDHIEKADAGRIKQALRRHGFDYLANLVITVAVGFEKDGGVRAFQGLLVGEGVFESRNDGQDFAVFDQRFPSQMRRPPGKR